MYLWNRMCRTCRQNCRIVKFDFQCAKFYHDYATSSAYTKPDLSKPFQIEKKKINCIYMNDDKI